MSKISTTSSNQIFEGATQSGGVLRPVICIGSIGEEGSETQVVGALPVLGGRPFVAKGAINNSLTSYAESKNIGGVIQVTPGAPAGTILTAITLRVKALSSNITTIQTLGINIFDANPTASTYTDGQTNSLAAGDVAKQIQIVQNSLALSEAISADGAVIWTIPITGRIALDSSGNFYFTIYSWVSSLVLASANVLSWEANGTY